LCRADGSTHLARDDQSRFADQGLAGASPADGGQCQMAQREVVVDRGSVSMLGRPPVS